MERDINSLELYYRQLEMFNNYNFISRRRRSGPNIEDIRALLDCMKEELLKKGYSELMDEAFHVSCMLCLKWNMPIYQIQHKNYELTKPKPDGKCMIPAFASWWLLVYLAEYMQSGKIPDYIRNLEKFYGNYRMEIIDSSDVFRALEIIDACLAVQRKERKAAFSSEQETESLKQKKSIAIAAADETEKKKNVIFRENGKDMSQGKAVISDNDRMKQEKDTFTKAVCEQTEKEKNEILKEAHNQAEKEVNEILKQAHAQIEKEKKAILEQARREAEEEKQSILTAAHQQAEMLMEKASRDAERKVSQAEQRITGMATQKRLEFYSSQYAELQKNFTDVRKALFNTNEMMKRLEDAVYEGMTKKIYTQFEELYNLIADTKDSTLILAQQSKDQNLENTAYNMEVFLDMITEYLADFGIHTICSTPGERFQTKYHEAKGSQFDPRSAVIKRSLRNGFVWEEQVLQKERVEIER